MAQGKGENDGKQKDENINPEGVISRDARPGVEKGRNGRKAGKEAAGSCRIEGRGGMPDQGFQR